MSFILLILGVATVSAIAVLVLVWIQVDRRLSGRGAVTEVVNRLVHAEAELMQLRDRVEDLETIVTAGKVSGKRKDLLN